MRSLFRFFAKNHVLFLFFTLEIISVVLLVNYNNFQKVMFLNSSNKVSASIYESYNTVVGYFMLRKVNDDLAIQNTDLRNQIKAYEQLTGNVDSLRIREIKNRNTFWFTSAQVVNNSVNKQYNYITLDKGKVHGVQAGVQGIISNNMVVGVISNVSEKYSTGITLLNKRLTFSGKIKKNNVFGPISWEGVDFKYVNLYEIPPHVELSKGDTVVTSGFSSYFPGGLLIGTIESFEQKKGDSFYSIKVKLAVDFKSISFVDIIDNRDKLEIETLERATQDGENLD